MDHEHGWKAAYRWGAISTLLVTLLCVLDIVIGTSLGGDLTALPQTAVDRFAQFRLNPWAGLYGLDFLNMVTQLIFIPGYVALYAAHRESARPLALLALVVFLVGTAIFVTNNTALPMLDLSHKYAAATTEAQRNWLAGAGEALVARGAHGSPGAFVGFVLPNVAGLLMSWAMLRGGVFGAPTALAGLAGSLLILVYLILVTFVPAAKTMAMAISAPGGILLMAWMVLIARGFIRRSR